MDTGKRRMSPAIPKPKCLRSRTEMVKQGKMENVTVTPVNEIFYVLCDGKN